MAYTVLQLIADAYNESGITAVEFDTVTGSQYSKGLNFLNEILSKAAIDIGRVPYYTQYDFTLQQGVEEYFIPELNECELLVYYNDDVRYSMRKVTRREYFATPRAENINSLPDQWHIERTLGGSNIYLYFSPEQDYSAMLWGLFSVNNVTLNQDLQLIFDPYWIAYIRYDLCRSLCALNNVDVPVSVLSQYIEYDRLIRKRSAKLDLKTNSISTVPSDDALSYAQINLGRGWTPT